MEQLTSRGPAAWDCIELFPESCPGCSKFATLVESNEHGCESEATDAAILDMCPLLRSGVAAGSDAAFVSRCLPRPGGEISKLTWERSVADLGLDAVGYVENTSAVHLGPSQVSAVLVDGARVDVGSSKGYAMVDGIKVELLKPRRCPLGPPTPMVTPSRQRQEPTQSALWPAR